MDNARNQREFIFTVLFFGGLWGFVEATLGYLLHLIPELTAMPPISGLILFPVGLFIMIKAMKHTGQVSAIPSVALIAAIIKIASAFLPFVAFRFVRNPAIAILSEGAVAWVVLGVSQWKMDYQLPVKVLILSFGWRALFLAMNLLFGLTGIANKPMAIQRRFIFLDGFIDAAIIFSIALLLWLAARNTRLVGKKMNYGPVTAFAALIAGIGGQLVFAGL